MKRMLKIDFEKGKLKEKEVDNEVRQLQILKKRLNVSNKEIWGMIETLIKAGYQKHHYAFLTQSGQAYSITFDEIQASLVKGGKKSYKAYRKEGTMAVRKGQPIMGEKRRRCHR